MKKVVGCSDGPSINVGEGEGTSLALPSLHLFVTIHTPQPYSASSSFLLPPKGPKEEGMQTAIQKKSLAWSGGVFFRPLQRNSLVLKVLSFCRGLVDPHVG